MTTTTTRFTVHVAGERWTSGAKRRTRQSIRMFVKHMSFDGDRLTKIWSTANQAEAFRMSETTALDVAVQLEQRFRMVDVQVDTAA